MTEPIIRFEGDAPGLPIWFVATGEMSQNFQETYNVEITAYDKDVADGGAAGQTPHPADMNFDRGKFENLQFTVQLFSGAQVNGSEIYSGRQIVGVAELLFRLSMPRRRGSSFIGPPLLNAQYGAFWRAKGLFQKVTFISQGAWDSEGFPTLVTLQIEFARHFGGQAGAGGVYANAKTDDLAKATAQRFAFFEGPGRR